LSSNSAAGKPVVASKAIIRPELEGNPWAGFFQKPVATLKTA